MLKGPQLECSMRTRSRQAVPVSPLKLWRSMLRIDCAPLLGPGSRRATRFVRCAHCARTGAASQIFGSALCAPTPDAALLAATDSLPARHHLPLRHQHGARSDGSAKAVLQRGVRIGCAAHLRRQEDDLWCTERENGLQRPSENQERSSDSAGEAVGV